MAPEACWRPVAAYGLPEDFPQDVGLSYIIEDRVRIVLSGTWI
jgi:hypothetical protein